MALPRADRVPLPDGGWVEARTTGGGDRTPVLLLRPLGGTMALWGDVATILGRDRCVVMFDPRGAGRSSRPPWRLGTRGMADDARRVLDHLGIGRAHVVGLSLGGMVAQWLAIDGRSRVDRLVLVSRLPRARRASLRAWRLATAIAPVLAGRGDDVERNLVVRLLSAGFKAEAPDRVAAVAAIVCAAPATRASLVKGLLAAARHELGRRRLDPELPTLLVVGAHDPLMTADAQRELAQWLPRARLEVIASGHDVSLERPRELAALVAHFLAQAPDQQARVTR
jgi:pimeloyl-ACP methyl ester carboxylesterase